MGQRLVQAFEGIRQRGRPGVIPFLTAGFPDLPTTAALVAALARTGADAIELGVPFSDPLADGPTIQRTSYHALNKGVTLQLCLDLCSQLRRQGVDVPLVLMGYYNPLLSYGLEPFARAASAAGVDGVIVADLPPEEADSLREMCRPRQIDLIALLAPTSTDERIQRACQMATGFIYCVSITGVTGARGELPPGVFELVRRVRTHTQLPLAVGFGISKRSQVEAIGRHAEAAIVGSALLDTVAKAPPGQEVSAACRFVAELAGLSIPSGS